MGNSGIGRFEESKKYLKDKNVLYVATKNVDYLRVVQEINFLKGNSTSVNCIISERKGYFLRIIDVFIKLLFADIREYDLIFFGFQAQFVVPFFYWKMRRKEIWSDFFISLYDTLVFDRKKLKQNSFLARVAYILDKYTIDKSDLVVCDTIAHGNYFCEEFKVDHSKLNVFYLEADKSIYYPREVSKPEQYRNKFVVFYFGSVLPLQGVNIVLEAAELLQDNEKIHFIVVGPIGNKIVKKELENITYIEWLPQQKLAQFIAMADLCLAGHFCETINKAKRTIPGKAYIYDAMDKKIVLGDGEANHELFNASEKYHFVKMGDAKDLADTVLNISLGEL